MIKPALSVRPKLQGLELGRGLAAVSVVLFHADHAISEPKFYGQHPFGGLLSGFNAGVDFFFVLSGFIIAWIHWDDIGQPNRVGRYAASRFFRIFPPYWTFLLPLAFVYILNPSLGAPSQRNPVNVALSFLLLPYPDPPVYPGAWTLICELFFYVVFAAIIAIGRKALWVLPAWAVAILIASSYQPMPYIIGTYLSSYNLEFLIGVCAAMTLINVRIPMPRAVAMAGAALFIATMVYFPSTTDDLLLRLAYGIFGFMTIIGLVEWERSLGLRIPSALLLLGSATYAIYLTHGVAMSIALRILRPFDNRLPLALVSVILLSAGIVGGVAYHLLVEKPLIRYLKNKFVQTGSHSAPHEAR